MYDVQVNKQELKNALYFFDRTGSDLRDSEACMFTLVVHDRTILPYLRYELRKELGVPDRDIDSVLVYDRVPMRIAYFYDDKGNVVDEEIRGFYITDSVNTISPIPCDNISEEHIAVLSSCTGLEDEIPNYIVSRVERNVHSLY